VVRATVYPVEAPTAPAPCVHHWVLGPPCGLWIHGVCLKCNAERDFPAEPELRGKWGHGVRVHTVATKQTANRKGAAMNPSQQEKRSLKWYDERKAAILGDVQQLGKEGARKKWGMRGNTLDRLIARWYTGKASTSKAEGSAQEVVGAQQLWKALSRDQDQAHAYADRILTELVNRKLLAGNYLSVGMCIMEVLRELGLFTELAPPVPADRPGSLPSPS